MSAENIYEMASEGYRRQPDMLGEFFTPEFDTMFSNDHALHSHTFGGDLFGHETFASLPLQDNTGAPMQDRNNNATATATAAPRTMDHLGRADGPSSLPTNKSSSHTDKRSMTNPPWFPPPLFKQAKSALNAGWADEFLPFSRHDITNKKEEMAATWEVIGKESSHTVHVHFAAVCIDEESYHGRWIDVMDLSNGTRQTYLIRYHANGTNSSSWKIWCFEITPPEGVELDESMYGTIASIRKTMEALTSDPHNEPHDGHGDQDRLEDITDNLPVLKRKKKSSCLKRTNLRSSPQTKEHRQPTCYSIPSSPEADTSYGNCPPNHLNAPGKPTSEYGSETRRGKKRARRDLSGVPGVDTAQNRQKGAPKQHTEMDTIEVEATRPPTTPENVLSCISTPAKETAARSVVAEDRSTGPLTEPRAPAAATSAESSVACQETVPDSPAYSLRVRENVVFYGKDCARSGRSSESCNSPEALLRFARMVGVVSQSMHRAGNFILWVQLRGGGDEVPTGAFSWVVGNEAKVRDEMKIRGIDFVSFLNDAWKHSRSLLAEDPSWVCELDVSVEEF